MAEDFYVVPGETAPQGCPSARTYSTLDDAVERVETTPGSGHVIHLVVGHTYAGADASTIILDVEDLSILANVDHQCQPITPSEPATLSGTGTESEAMIQVIRSRVRLNNVAIVRGAAGGLKVEASDVTLVRSAIEHNVGLGGVQVTATTGQSVARFEAIDSDFFDNTSSGSGGAILCHSNSASQASIHLRRDTRLVGNQAGVDGGAIELRDGCTLEVANEGDQSPVFVSNRAERHGGAISSPPGSVRVQVDVLGALFFDNLAGSLGGAIGLRSDASLLVQDSRFIENRGFAGGAVAAVNLASMQFFSTRFISNSAGDSGGAVVFSRDPLVQPAGSLASFQGNCDSTDLSIGRHCAEFFDNEVTGGPGKGGAIASFGVGLDVREFAFVDNRADNGPAISVDVRPAQNPLAARVTLTNVLLHDAPNTFVLLDDEGGPVSFVARHVTAVSAPLVGIVGVQFQTLIERSIIHPASLGPGGCNISSDQAALVDTARGPLRPSIDSPAVDPPACGNLPTFIDLDGFRRDGAPDWGAFEFEGIDPSPEPRPDRVFDSGFETAHPI